MRAKGTFDVLGGKVAGSNTYLTLVGLTGRIMDVAALACAVSDHDTIEKLA